MSNIILADSIVKTGESIQNTGFFNNHGNKVGLIMATIWTGLGGYMVYYNYKQNIEFSIKYYLLPIISLLLGIIIFVLYFILTMTQVDNIITNNVIGHISLIPIYLLILAILFMVK
jgi:hypothetical protein